MTSATVISTGDTINTDSVRSLHVAPTSNVTGVILEKGIMSFQSMEVVNESAFTIAFNTTPSTSNIADSDVEPVIAAHSSRSYTWNGDTSYWYPHMGTLAHASTHQEIVGSDQLVNYGLFERIARVTKTTSNATPAMFSGVSGNVDNTLQSGHGWTFQNNGAGSANYTTDFILGTQCIKLTTDGGGTNTARATSPRHSMDWTSQFIRVWLKFDSASYANINSVFVIVGSGASAFTNNAQCQLAGTSMNSLTEYAKPGEWVRFTLNPASFITISGTMDWTAIQDYRVTIKDTGAGAATLLFGGIDFIPNDTTYPHGVVSFTFDDSYVGQFTMGRTYLETYGYKGTFYLIQDVIGKNNTLYMTQAQVDQVQTLGHEIAFHSEYAADHNITGGFTGISQAELMSNIGLQKGWMHTKGYRGVNHMAYPQGMYDTTLLGIMAQQFAAARTVTYRSIETMPVANPLRLRAISTGVDVNVAATPNGTAGTLEWYLDQIYTYGGWLIFITHNIVTSGAATTDTLQSKFQTIVDYVNTKGIPVRTVGDVLGI